MSPHAETTVDQATHGSGIRNAEAGTGSDQQKLDRKDRQSGDKLADAPADSGDEHAHSKSPQGRADADPSVSDDEDD